MYSDKRNFVVQANGQLMRAEAYKPIIVAYRNGNPVRLDEVAHVFDGVENDRSAAWQAGERCVMISIRKQPGTNVVDVVDRIKAGPARWTMKVTVANAGDQTSDPSKAWPQDRRSVEVGTLTVDKIEAEADGPCRDINFDPTVLPNGIRPSDDPFPAARSAAYRVSYDRRTAEEKDYPRTATGAAQ